MDYLLVASRVQFITIAVLYYSQLQTKIRFRRPHNTRHLSKIQGGKGTFFLSHVGVLSCYPHPLIPNFTRFPPVCSV